MVFPSNVIVKNTNCSQRTYSSELGNKGKAFLRNNINNTVCPFSGGENGYRIHDYLEIVNFNAFCILIVHKINGKDWISNHFYYTLLRRACEKISVN